ncbi:MAG: hypothetical protein ACI8SR_003411 [Oceanicoccus sp.]|jgi:hypothetical protein
MDIIDVDIYLSPDEVQRAYGGVDQVFAKALDGRSIRFPVKILWQFISHNGIHGRFRIQYGKDGQFESVTRLL